MKEILHKITTFTVSYKFLFVAWLIMGICNIVSGDISRLNYICVWLLLLIEYAEKMMKEKK